MLETGSLQGSSQSSHMQKMADTTVAVRRNYWKFCLVSFFHFNVLKKYLGCGFTLKKCLIHHASIRIGDFSEKKQIFFFMGSVKKAHRKIAYIHVPNEDVC